VNKTLTDFGRGIIEKHAKVTLVGHSTVCAIGTVEGKSILR
jgi:hypothetical protein